MNSSETISFQSVQETELTKETKEKILLSINETDVSLRTGLETLLHLLKEQQEFKPCLEKKFLIQFLRNSKYDCAKAFARIKKFYNIQKQYPEFFEFRTEEALAKAAVNNVKVSPYRLKDCSGLIIHRYFKLDPSELLVKEKFYLDILFIYKLLENPLNQICGFTFLVDVAGLSFSKVSQYNFEYLKVILDVMQGAFPYRTKAIHFINVPSVFRIIYNISYPFLTKKLKNRLHFHSDSEFKDLHSFLPPEVLPKEYGGYLEESELINGMDNIHDKEKYFREHSPYLYTEDKKLKS